MNILADESVDLGIINELRKKGFTVKSVCEETPGISDQLVLKMTVENNSLLITEDKDFGELAYRLKLKHKGLLLIRLSELPRPERIATVVIHIKQYSKELFEKFSVLTKRGLRIKSQIRRK